MKIESVSYKHGMLKKLSHKKRLRPAYFTGDEIPDEVETIIEKNDILSLSGVLGSKKGGKRVFPLCSILREKVRKS